MAPVSDCRLSSKSSQGSFFARRLAKLPMWNSDGLQRRLHLCPGQRRRDGRLRGPPDGVGRHDRLREAVAEGIEVHAALARGDAGLHGQLLREGLREAVAEPVGELADLVAVGPGADRHEDVQALLARRLRKRDEVQGVERLLDLQAGARRVRKLPGVRIEVEAHPVGLARAPPCGRSRRGSRCSRG